MGQIQDRSNFLLLGSRKPKIHAFISERFEFEEGPKINTPFTANELIECLDDLGYEADLKNLDSERNDICEYIKITTDEDLEWCVYLGFTGPFYEEFEVLSHLYTSENPHLEANNWHMDDHLSVVTVVYDEATGNPEYSNGFFTLEQRMKCVRDDLPLVSFVENSLLLWEDEFDEFIAQLCPEIPKGDY